MAISLRLNEKDTTLIKNYAALHNISLSELFRQAVMEKIEDEYDISVTDEAYKEYLENPKTYSIDEAEEILNKWASIL